MTSKHRSWVRAARAATKLPPHPEEARRAVSKDGSKHRVPAVVLRDAMLRMAPQDEGSRNLATERFTASQDEVGV